MKRFLKIFLKVTGILLAASGILAALAYTQLWNPHVRVSVEPSVRFPLSVEQKLADFEYLYNTLKESFPYFEVKKRQYGMDWLSKKEEFRKRIKATKNDIEYYTVLSEILMLLQNGHTHIIAPAAEMEDYREIYSGPQPWSQVLGNSRVKEYYAYWEDILPQNDSATIPVSFRYIEGSYFASRNLMYTEKSTDELGIPMGSKLLKVDGVDVEAYIEGLITQRLLRFDTARNKIKLNVFSIRSDDEVRLTFEMPDGSIKEKSVKPFRPDALNEVSRSLPEHLYSTEIIEPGKVAYLKLPSLSSAYVRKDREGIRSFLEGISNYSGLIIDIRGNGGGSTNYWADNIVPLLTDRTLSTKNYLLFRDSDYLKPFIKNKTFIEYYRLKPIEALSFVSEKPGFYYSDNHGVYEEIGFTIKPTAPVGFKGKIILLVDDNVYSSAEAFAAFAKDTKWAELIGTRTGGDGIGFDPVVAALPLSGLTIRFPADMGLNPDGSINEEVATMPDVYVEPSYKDFMDRINKENELGRKLSFKESLLYDTILKKAMELALKN